jgi:ATP-dependent helicase/nuclease subunit A
MSDAGARERAQTEFAKPLLLEAGAGTGKTAVLVARIVAWCLGQGWEKHARVDASDDAIARSVLSRVVAITFTEAAAAEMATRVADALRALALGTLPVGVLEAALPPPDLRTARARALRGALDHLTLRTIHAFCRRLLASHPLEAGLHPALEVDADQQHAALAAREVLEASLLAAFQAGGDARAWAALAEARIGPADLEAALVELLGEGARESDLAKEALAESAYAALGGELSRALRTLADAAGGRFAKAKQVTTAQDVMECAEQLADWLDEEPLSIARLASVPADELAPAGIRERVRKWASGAADAVGTMESRALGDAEGALILAARALEPLLDHFAKLDPAALAAARSVLSELLASARALLRQRGIATFGALLRDAHELAALPEVRAALRTSFDQLLVDEFQDTDATQCALLEALAFGAGPRPALFVVGDPKQSIYGWRNADLAAYDAFKQRLESEGGEIRELTVSHRSVKPILDEVERVIAPVMHAEPGLQAAFQRLEVSPRRSVEAGFTDGGRAAVEHWIGTQQNSKDEWKEPDARTRSEREARALAADLVQLHREHGLRFGDVGVLLRATTELPVVLGALREAGVPFVVERETAFYQRREVIDALAWVRCVIDPHDQLALVTTLRSATVGLPDAGLVALLKHCRIGTIGRIGRDAEALPHALEQLALAAQERAAGVPGLDALGGWPASVARFFRDLAALREAFAALPADRFVEELRVRSGIEATEAARHLGAHRVATLDRVFRDLAQWADELHGSPSQLLAALRRSGGEVREQQEGRPTSLADDAVRVLTVHKAKGLDFKHVYFLQLHRSDRGNPNPKPTQVWRAEREYQLLGLASPGAWRLLAHAKRREAQERRRLLYVALTRAQDRLVISWCPETKHAPLADQAASLGELLLARAGRPDNARVLAADETSDGGTVKWRHIIRFTEATVAPLEVAHAGALPSAAAVACDEDALRSARREAARCEMRPVQRVASELTHDDEANAARTLPDDEAPEAASERPDRARRVAMAAGSAVHAALEHARFDASASELRAHGEAAIAAALASLEPADECGEAEQRARAIWARACAGPLLAKLREIAPRIVARELPVLLAPGELAASDDAPVGFVSGAIDLLYRDERGEYVVADYKTDEAESDAELAALTAKYAPQGAAYTRAVQLSLDLTIAPRFELWFLQAGEVRATER